MDKKRVWVGNFIAASSAFLLVCGITFLYAVRYGASTMFSNSVTEIVLFAAALYLGVRFFKGRVSGRLIVFGLMGGLVFAACTAFGYSLYYTDTIWKNFTLAAVPCLTPFFGICTAFGLRTLGGVHMKAEDLKAEEPEETKKPEESRAPFRVRRYLITFGLLFLSWVPVLLASWPGIFSYDSGTQLAQWADGAVTSHHPILHTALLGVTRMIGLALTGSNQTGALIYSIVQMLIMSALYAYVLLFLYRKGAPRWLRAGAFIFLAFHPANSLMALCATKDSIFTAIFAVFIVQIIEMADDRERFFGSVKKQVVFCVTVFFLFAFRNNAFHAFLICIPFLLFAFRRYWKRMLLLIAVCLCLYGVYTGPVYGALGIGEGDVREMCSVIMQQVARVYNLDYLGLTDEEIEAFTEIIDEDAFGSYLSYFSDPIKAYFDGDEFAEDPWPFLKAWLSAGLRHKKIYIDSFLANTYGYWYPGNSIVETSKGKDYFEYKCSEYREDVDVVMESKLPALSDFYSGIANESSFQNIPVVSAIFGLGTYTWLMFFACLLLLYSKRYGDIIVMIPFAAYFFTNLLGPVVKLRYHYPFIACAPIFIYMIWRTWKAAGGAYGQDSGSHTLLQ